MSSIQNQIYFSAKNMQNFFWVFPRVFPSSTGVLIWNVLIRRIVLGKYLLIVVQIPIKSLKNLQKFPVLGFTAKIIFSLDWKHYNKSMLAYEVHTARVQFSQIFHMIASNLHLRINLNAKKLNLWQHYWWK
jgi:hypothetical protein